MDQWKLDSLMILIRSMKLDQILGAQIKRFIDDGTIDKIISFADGLDELNKRLANIERLLSDAIPGKLIDVDATDVTSGADPADSKRQSFNGPGIEQKLFEQHRSD